MFNRYKYEIIRQLEDIHMYGYAKQVGITLTGRKIIKLLLFYITIIVQNVGHFRQYVTYTYFLRSDAEVQ